MNEQGAEIVSRAPGNLGFLATLPLPNVDSSIAEAAYCLDELHADGVGLMTNYGGAYLGDQTAASLNGVLRRSGSEEILQGSKNGCRCLQA